MSRYLVDKLLYRVDRDPQSLSAYIAEPAAYVARWEETDGLHVTDVETTSGHNFTAQERAALATRDYETLYTLGAHPFLLWTFMLAVYGSEFPKAVDFRKVYTDRIRPHGRPGFST